MAQLEKRGFTAKVSPGALKMAAGFYAPRGKRYPSYGQIADMCDVSKSTIANLWSGKRDGVNPETAAKIERGLRVEKGSIFQLVALNVDSTINRRAA